MELSVEKENFDAMLLLGDLYYVGFFDQQDLDNDTVYYHKAALRNSGRAYYNLAMISRVEQDVESMKVYLTKSANLGYGKAIELYNSLLE